ncbi:protein FAM110B-like [Mizuhopecten yessoensis]|uniref:Centrosome-associated FAM110 C-terminal domain-containing protein n=1 Tax=Mizuhopecten yessoensis TaxID=6573 RepID=A0A210Q3Z1_MIZYE|nr:protein FAM110B-like [Mizuhopecten yessoensis]XP_021367789.1 protein FAM110B-like [Mizuhopecten yessoensis]XP_021367790.1 protein FAM110B-like [Mizuhopecten yessoensis]XP_021367791.1 protein FAM110B-like [Mizuhopecten yessoensis]XP_021367792.1 protein FAM110B-like [Mizuhopecten yessoensis]XP_021367793.1 protein FAM110B-like [Mizuhopecten yessoensis]XP_021367794.1 protein FAM110B-like [Mizuhopecten yessoensis]OWF43450.1 hypothetical protein KP79_PYT08215 [Mizuhopecten yessoensis]
MSVQTSITMTPDRIRNKGPDFLRNHVSSSNNNIFAHRRKSAVELLEASKSEYVKSQSVLKSRQELKHPENLHIGKQTPSHLGRSKSEFSLAVGDSDLNGNCSFIVGRPVVSVLPSGEREKTKSRPPDLPPKPSKFNISSGTERLNQVHQCVETSDSSKINTFENGRPRCISANSTSSNCVSDKSDQSNSNCSKSRTSTQKMNSKSKDGDTEPKLSRSRDPERPPRSRDCLLPSTYQSLSTSVTVLVEKRCAGTSTTHTPTDTAILRRRKKTLHRSQSDLSCRHSRNSSDFSDLSSRLSRTSTELERFFNEMGIDRSVLDPMMKLQHNHKKESDYFESLSSLELGSEDRSSLSGVSQGAKSQADKDKKDDGKERNSPQGTQVEKNARIIKWLCNVKKARFPPPQQAS